MSREVAERGEGNGAIRIEVPNVSGDSSIDTASVAAERGEGKREISIDMTNVSDDISRDTAAVAPVRDRPSTSSGSPSPRLLRLVKRIKKKLPEPNDADGPVPSIYRVPPHMRNIDKEAYEPWLVSIGPLHHGKERLLPMEQIKREYLRDLLDRHDTNSLEKYVAVIHNCLRRAREQYSEKIELSDDEFVEMLVVDGCFIIEYLFKRVFGTTKNTAFLASVRWGFAHLRRDLMLLENQIPFFVLTELFHETKITAVPEGLVELVLKFLRIERPPRVDLEPANVLHLLHVYHMCLNPDLVEEEPLPRPSGQRAMNGAALKVLRLPRSTIDLISKSSFAFLYLIFIRRWPCGIVAAEKPKSRMIPCATELRGAGIKFRKKVTKENFLKVSLREGILEIPSLSVDETTSSKLRNLIALEQSCKPKVKNHFTSYCVLMDNIVNTAGDVAILQRCGILESKLGSDGEVADLFNSLRKGTHLNFKDHYNAKLFQDVLAFCDVPQHKWRASLVHNYFSSPWALISVLAGFLLIFLAIIQAICSLISTVRRF